MPALLVTPDVGFFYLGGGGSREKVKGQNMAWMFQYERRIALWIHLNKKLLIISLETNEALKQNMGTKWKKIPHHFNSSKMQ